MTKNDLKHLPEFYDTYIHQVADDVALIEELENTLTLFDSQIEQLSKKATYAYQNGKWTVKQVLQHIVDNERIMGYRALRISRKETIDLPGYDQVPFTENSDTSQRQISGLIEEFKLLRKSNILMLKNCTTKMLLLEGSCSGIQISVLALGFVLIGHQLHHLKTLQERYFTS